MHAPARPSRPSLHLRRRLVARCLAGAFAVAFCAVSLPATPASARSRQEKKALELTNQAKEAYKARRFMQAAMLFKQAYAQVPEPTLLFNAARAYQKGGKLHEALPLFRLYLTLATYNDEETRSGRAEAVEHITRINKVLQQREEARRRKAAADADALDAAKKKAAGAATQTPQAGPATPPTQPLPTPSQPPKTTPQPGPRGPGPMKSSPVITGPPPAGTTDIKPPELGGKKPIHRPKLFSRIRKGAWTDREIAAISLMTSGAVIVVTGVVLHAVAGSTLDDMDSELAKQQQQSGTIFYRGLTQQEAQDAIDSHDGYRVGGSMLLTIGAVAAGVGGYLWLTRRLDDGGKLAIAPAVGPNQLGWVVQGRF